MQLEPLVLFIGGNTEFSEGMPREHAPKARPNAKAAQGASKKRGMQKPPPASISLKQLLEVGVELFKRGVDVPALVLDPASLRGD